jgi:hypothetical protein
MLRKTAVFRNASPCSLICATVWEKSATSAGYKREAHSSTFKMKAAGTAEMVVLVNEAVLRRIIETSAPPLNLGSAEPRVSAKECQGFRETKMRNGGRVLLAVLNLCLRTQIRVATFDVSHSDASHSDASHSDIDSTQSIAASIQKFYNSPVKSVSTACHRCSIKADSHIPCSSHAVLMPFPCHAFPPRV